MDSLTGSMKDVAFATSPREFDLSYSTTLEEIMQGSAPDAVPDQGRRSRPTHLV